MSYVHAINAARWRTSVGKSCCVLCFWNDCKRSKRRTVRRQKAMKRVRPVHIAFFSNVAFRSHLYCKPQDPDSSFIVRSFGGLEVSTLFVRAVHSGLSMCITSELYLRDVRRPCICTSCQILAVVSGTSLDLCLIPTLRKSLSKQLITTAPCFTSVIEQLPRSDSSPPPTQCTMQERK